MRSCLHLVLFFLVVSVAATMCAAEGLRNPFWPKGYVGEMSPISAEVRKKPKPKPAPKPVAVQPRVDPKVVAAKAAAEKAAREKAEKEAAERAAKEAAAREAAAKKAAAEKAAQEAAAKAEAERKRVIGPEDWKKARKALKIGNPAVFKAEDGTTRSTISINGNIYGDGDLMSVTHEGIRFTWRVQGLAGGEKLRLERIKARRVK